MRPIVRVLLVVGLLGIWLTGAVSIGEAAPRAVEPSEARATDVQEDSFVVSWTTDVPSSGAVAVSTSQEMTDPVRVDEGTGPSLVHRITVNGLNPDTTYFFQTISDSFADGPYEQATGPIVEFPPQPNSVSGQVIEASTELPAPDRVLVYARVIEDNGEGSEGESSWVSGVTDNNGYFTIDLLVRAERRNTEIFRAKSILSG